MQIANILILIYIISITNTKAVKNKRCKKKKLFLDYTNPRTGNESNDAQEKQGSQNPGIGNDSNDDQEKQGNLIPPGYLTCNNTILSKLNIQGDAILETLSEQNLEDCRAICEARYETNLETQKCRAFLSWASTTTCTLFTVPINEVMKFAEEIGAPRDCTSSFNLCDDTEGTCTMTMEPYNQKQMQNSGDTGLEECRNNCNLQTKCFFYIYERKSRICKLFKNPVKSCTQNLGIPKHLEKCDDTTTPGNLGTTLPVEISTTTEPLNISTPSDCKYGPYKKSTGEIICFIRLQDNVNWHAAKSGCKSSDAKLPEIYTKQDNDIFINLIPNAHGFWDGIWLGLNDIEVEGDFVWDSSGLRPNYTNFYNQNNHGDEDCVKFLTNGQWNDDKCNSTAGHFVYCELTLGTSPFASTASSGNFHTLCRIDGKWFFTQTCHEGMP